MILPVSVLALPKFINFESFFLIGVDKNVILKIAMISYWHENLPLHMALLRRVRTSSTLRRLINTQIIRELLLL